jgi:hypothetical protein
VTTVTTGYLADGDEGVMATFRAMTALANIGQTDPGVVYLARTLAGTDGTSQAAVARAIRGWLRAVWRYVDDPVDTELLISPVTMVQTYIATGMISGDCDEAAILGAALGKAVGIPAAFTGLAFDTPDDDPARLAHVFASLLPNDGGPCNLDITKGAGPFPAVTRTLTVEV